MREAIYNVLIIILTNDIINNYGYFTGKLKSLEFDGYLIYDNKEHQKDNIELYKNIKEYTLEEALCNKVETNPPQYYNESSIVKKLESSGIGRPSTYSNIINTLYNVIFEKELSEEYNLSTGVRASKADVIRYMNRFR